MTQFTLDTGIIHFIGIGGIGMSGIAEVLFDLGYQVRGSDIQENSNIDRLRKKGITIYIGQNEKNMNNASVAVVSSAIKSDNKELLTAKDLRIPILKRADMLAELMRFKKSIAVGGSHGKTTTTSMISSILVTSKSDPTIINGGIIESYQSNARLGKGAWMVVEADESDGTFTRLPATIAVLTNIDEEHLDFYKNYKNLKKSFRSFIENLPFYGFASICIDNPEALELKENIKDRKIVSYGLNSSANFTADSLVFKKGKSFFNIKIKKSTNSKDIIYKDFCISLPGKYNITNALGAISVCYELGISIVNIRKGLKNFKGVKRRFSLIDKINGISFIDDYAHHPTEIKCILEAACSVCEGKIVVVFEPHRYSRVFSLYKKFVNSFDNADIVFITDIYSAGEDKIKGISKEKLASSISLNGVKDVRLLKNYETLHSNLIEICNRGDFIIFLGAGNISKVAKKITEQFRAELTKSI